MIELLLLPLFAGVAVCLVAGPLGSFVVWRRMAYFGDTLAHSALLGVALSLLAQISSELSIVLCAIAIALLLSVLEKKQNLSTDTLLGIVAHSSLAIGLLAVSAFSNTRIDLSAYLFGDLLLVSLRDLALIASASATCLVFVVAFWKPLLLISVDEELAKVEGHNVSLLRALIMVLVAVFVAFSIKIVGVLLISALLIIPAASARHIARSPEAMALLASCFALVSVIIGLFASFSFDLPAGPSIICGCTFLFVTASLVAWRMRS